MSIYSELASAEKDNREFALVTVTAVNGSAARGPGTQMIVYPDGSVYGTVGGGIVEHGAKKDALEAIRTGEPLCAQYDIPAGGPKSDVLSGSVSCFIHPRKASKKLYLFGAGHVAQEVIPLAKRVGFHVTVIDPRENLSKTGNAAMADSFVLSDYSVIDTMSFDSGSYILIGTFDHAIDGELLGKALRSGAAYIGMLGGKPKIRAVFSKLRNAGFTDDELMRAYTPVGLDIGGQTPEQIALSIVSEIFAVSNGRTGGFSRLPIE